MNLYRYAEQCGALARELLDSLSRQDRAALDRWFEEHDLKSWWAWRDTHEETIRAYAAATASQRARKKCWRELQPRLTWAAAQYCLEAQALLQVIEPLEPGCSYRHMAALAGQAYQDLLGSRIPDWPVDDL